MSLTAENNEHHKIDSTRLLATVAVRDILRDKENWRNVDNVKMEYTFKSSNRDRVSVDAILYELDAMAIDKLGHSHRSDIEEKTAGSTTKITMDSGLLTQLLRDQEFHHQSIRPLSRIKS